MTIFTLKSASIVLAVLAAFVANSPASAAPAPGYSLCGAPKRQLANENQDGNPGVGSINANKKLASSMLDDFINKRDVSRVDKYFENRTYIQHNPTAPDGVDVLIQIVNSLPPNARYEPGVVLAEGDFVMAHGRYVGLGPAPIIGVDIWRVENGKLLEHWDLLQPEVPANQTRSGRSMLSDATADVGPKDPRRENANKELARLTVEKILIGKDHSLVPQVFGPNPTLIQHNPLVPDGVDAFLGVSNSVAANATYDRGLAIADGNFVMLHGRYNNLLGPQQVIGVDIFRFDNGKLVEHWDVLQEEVPVDQTKSGRSMLTPAL
ncbi:hypothetical protein HK102_001144 [Quaeritorhiza haematococci]|nr:hypothetical protein HK102_001144 [Quaeritorhiza haematococci]